MYNLFSTPEKRLQRQLDAHRRQGLLEVPSFRHVTEQDGEQWRDFMLESRGNTGPPNLARTPEQEKQRSHFLNTTDFSGGLPTHSNELSVPRPMAQRMTVSVETASVF